MKKKSRIFSITSKIINVLAFLLASFFTWLQFDNVSFNPLFTIEGANIMFKATLAIYYFSWVYGCLFDLKDEEYSIAVIPNKGKLSFTAFLSILFLGVIFGALCWANTFIKFIIILDIFFVFNLISWRYLVRFIKPTLKTNHDKLKGKFAYEYHNIIKKYLLGEWQWFRFLYGFILIILLNILIFFNLVSKMTILLRTNSETVISVGFLIYVLTFESWIWYKRWERKLTFNIYDTLDEEYSLINENVSL